MHLPQETIRKTRQGEPLSSDELKTFFDGYLNNEVADYQVAAWLMAVLLKGLSRDETATLTRLMRDSGEVFNWDGPRSHVVDKHSTGGVGDKTSLIILPLCVLEGLKMPMIAGRGLGHTGGTLDKLEAVGWNVFPQPEEARRLVREIGGAFMGQTEHMVPLDRRLYALRDVTATVESIPLIVASILSKKLAEGLGNLVMDVKCGSGAFMKDFDDARKLAEELRIVGKACGLNVSCFLTDMSSPLGRFAGNALEVYECIQVLQGAGPSSTRELSLELATEAVRLADPSRSPAEIKQNLSRHLDSGAAFELFKKLGREQGAQVKLLEQAESMLRAKYVLPVHAKPVPNGTQTRHVSAIDVRSLGLAVVQLGGGRRLQTDTIDPWVGLSDMLHVGASISDDEPLAFVHANDRSKGEIAVEMVRKAYHLVPAAVATNPLIHELLRGDE